LVRRTLRKCFDRRAVSQVISAVILTGAAIALSMAVLAWATSRSFDYTKDYGEVTDSEIARLKERLTVECVFYDRSSGNISIYLLNCGGIDNVKIQSVHLKSNTWQTFSSLSLKFLNGTTIPDQDLDRGEEGYVVLFLSNTLETGVYYCIRIVTERGSLFDSGFVA